MLLQNAQEIFYLSVAGGFIILVIFLCVLIIDIIFILRDINKITDTVKTTVDQVNEYVIKPVKLINRVIENVKPVIDVVMEKIEERKKKRK